MATILDAAGFDPSFIIGTTPLNLGVNARAGAGEAFVLEADEYDRTFLRFFPRLAVVTNIEFDHPDTFRDYDDVLSTFAMFAENLPADGALIACADDDGCSAMLRRARPRATVVDYGIHRGLWRARDPHPNPLGGMDFAFQGAGVNGAIEGRCSLRVSGEHNVLNALAALAVADACGVPIAQAAQALSSYRGAERRFELRGEANGIRVIDDYAHHPTEIKATLRGARLRYPLGNIWAVWQREVGEKLFDEVLRHLVLECGGIFPLVLVIGGADVGRDREARRHGDPHLGHLGEVRALAAEQVLHARLALGLAIAEGVDPLPASHRPSPFTSSRPRTNAAADEWFACAATMAPRRGHAEKRMNNQ